MRYQFDSARFWGWMLLFHVIGLWEILILGAIAPIGRTQILVIIAIYVAGITVILVLQISPVKDFYALKAPIEERKKKRTYEKHLVLVRVAIGQVRDLDADVELNFWGSGWEKQ